MSNNKNITNLYSNEIYAKTKKYQRIYGFDIGQGKHATWNNEADAFKHTFMSADMALKFGLVLSELIGNHHEDSNKTNPPYEENMDKWNNYCGREIAKEIRKEYNPLQVILMINSGEMDDVIAKKVIIKMRNGELITNPFKDKRSFEKKLKGSSTGYASNIEHIFTREEIDKMSIEEWQKNEKAIMQQLKEKGIPSEQELKTYYKNTHQQNANGHWVTIDGNHVFIED